MKKQIATFFVLAVLIAFGFHSARFERTRLINRMVRTIYTESGADKNDFMQPIEPPSIPADGVVDVSGPFMDALRPLYGEFFTEPAYLDFMRSRLAYTSVSVAEEYGCRVRVRSIAVTPASDGGAAYDLEAKLLFSKGNTGELATLPGYVRFSAEEPLKVEYLWLSDLPAAKLKKFSS